ncbi:glutaredoxin domain-containing cysteine-rich protein 1 [Oncorhynchus mykiss]|uniref:Glutaredoxin domain-containing cysteine-rich protein 1 n=1 Tax=Oncorhynchus mykiss TaxID=8022 RepID=A0A8C7R8H4_ONCMY|nr:glutaredoxin domain-containing cysteine-rich protein 1 [Oncorhynchus mykiss]
MEGTTSRQDKEKAQRTVRFRVASANSGHILTEVFKDDTLTLCGSVTDSVDSDCTSNSESEQVSSPPTSEANGHLCGLVGTAADDCGSDPDDLLMYASTKKELLFSNKRINICSKNGTVRGVKNKVSAGQALFNNLSNLSNVYTGNLRGSRPHLKKIPWEKDDGN